MAEGTKSYQDSIVMSNDDETLMRRTLLKCYGKKPLAFRVSKEHYRYLAEQIVALREDARRRTNNLFPYEQNHGNEAQTTRWQYSVRYLRRMINGRD